MFFFLYYRVTPESDIDDDLDGSVLSLGLFPGEYLDSSTALSGSGMADDRVFFRFEAAWDSSLHNSLLLNRVTPAGETIYMTISAYLEVRILTFGGILGWLHQWEESKGNISASLY